MSKSVSISRKSPKLRNTGRNIRINYKGKFVKVKIAKKKVFIDKKLRLKRHVLLDGGVHRRNQNRSFF